MPKLVFIIPGGGQSVRQKGYKKITRFFKLRGIRPVPAHISWNYRTMSDYIAEFLKQYEATRGKRVVYLWGFSWGAMIALITALKIKPAMLILCSLSPWFREDLLYVPLRWRKRVGKRRLQEFKQLSFRQVAKQVRCPTILVAGSTEKKELLAQGAKHNIAQKEYLETLEKIIDKL